MAARASEGITGTETAAPRRLSARALGRHTFLLAALAGALVGGGLRLIPASTAAPPGSSGQSGAASTACAAT